MTVGLLTAVLGCGSGGAPAEIEGMCNSLTACGAIAANETATCIEELDAATPDSASRAAAECAQCFETATCSQLLDGGCAQACTAFRESAYATPGQVSYTGGSSPCTEMSVENYAWSTSSGETIQLACAQTNWTIKTTPLVGGQASCGALTSSVGACTTQGTISSTKKDGRTFLTGSCSCTPPSGLTLKWMFEVPFRYF